MDKKVKPTETARAATKAVKKAKPAPPPVNLPNQLEDFLSVFPDLKANS